MSDKGSGDKDDLFEDLDKFFAPIKDVEWREESVPVEGPAAGAPTSEEPAVEPELEEPAAGVATEETVVLEEAEEEPVAAPGDGGRFAEEAEAEEEPLEEAEEAPEEIAAQDEWPVPEEGPEEPEVVEEEGPFETREMEISVGAVVSSPPPEYEGLPRAEEAAGAGMAADEAEEPSLEELEAAAEHFADSVREEEEAAAAAFVTEDLGAQEFAAEERPGGPEEVERSILEDLEEPPTRRSVRVGVSEGLGGPSWQEASTHEVGVEHERRSITRDVPAAFLTGVVLAAVAIASLIVGKAAFAVVVGLIVLVAQGELYGVMLKHHRQPATLIGLAAGVLIMAAAYLKGEGAMLAMGALSVMATFLWHMATPASHRRDVMNDIGHTLLGIAYIPLLAGYISVAVAQDDGKAMVVAIIGLAFAFDTAAFAIGSLFGGSMFRRPMAESISPAKSWEGLIGGTFVVLLLSLALVPSYVKVFENHLMWAAGLAIVVAAFATLGDLAESLLKRDLGIKDMGSILPGHGGVLDRIDSLLFVAPAAVLYVHLLVS